MAYFEPNIDATGIHVPNYDDILEKLISDYKEIFGDDVYIGEETKDYQLLSVLAKAKADVNALLVDNYNARNPNYATGNSLDILLPLVSMTRRGATYSTAVLTLGGTDGTVIAAGSQVMDANGYLWDLDETVEIADGSAEVSATCTVAGAIAAPIGTISSVYTIIEGWDSVTNEAAATLGLNVETDAEVRERRKKSVNLADNGTYDALMRALINLDGVEFADVRQNDTGSTDAHGIPAHTICCIVKGGESEAIAETIWKTKAPGIGTYGTETETYTDSYGHTNTIKFIRPTTLAVTVVVTINALSGYDSDRCEGIIKNAVANAINALGVGNAWSVTTAYRDIYNAFAGEELPFVITSVTGKTTDMGSASTVEVPCAFNKILSADDSTISITVNT